MIAEATPATTEMTNTARLANAAHRLLQAERTGDQDAIRTAENYLKFYERQVVAEGALARETARFEALTSEEREAERQHNEIGYASTL